MGATICLLRAVNVGGHQKLKMEDLREHLASLQFQDVRTYLQSGNVVFRAREKDPARLARKIEDSLESRFGFRPDVILRTTAELRGIVARNPFANRQGIEFSRLVVSFLAALPAADAREKIRSIKRDAEELHLDGRELFGYFPDGMGRSRVTPAVLERVLKVPGTARNWNTVLNLLDMAESLK